MPGNSYDFYINEFERAKSDCDNDLCVKTRTIDLLKNEWSGAFREFKSNFNAFQNQTGEDIDYKQLKQRYNQLYKKMETSKQNLEDEIDSLEQLIKSQSGDSQNYSNIIDERNTDINNTMNDIQKKSSQIDTVKEDIESNKKSKENISFFGIFPLSNLPLEITHVKVFYQILSILLLIFFIFLIRVIKDYDKVFSLNTVSLE